MNKKYIALVVIALIGVAIFFGAQSASATENPCDNYAYSGNYSTEPVDNPCYDDDCGPEEYGHFMSWHTGDDCPTTTYPENTTTTYPDSTTTTEYETTTTTAQESTTTTVAPTTTTAAPTTTTVNRGVSNPCGTALSCNNSDDNATTTSVAARPVAGQTQLPRTGSTTGPLLVVGLGLVGIGASILALKHRTV